MIPQSYATDTQAKATELASTVAAAFSPLQIASACTAVESFLRKHSPDQQRWFFSITFPALICRIFGFDDTPHPSATTKRHPSNGWIDVATSGSDSELSGRIFSLLSPNGLLLSSISGVDRLSLVKYVFPNERLPEWVRYMLRNEKDCQVLTDLCPLFRNRIKENPIKGSAYQVQLNVLEYYLFWFAYYPVCRGNSEGSETVKVQRTKMFRLENWSYSIPGLSSIKREAEKKTEGDLYLRLLYVYLHSFVPSQDLYVQPYRSSLLHYSPGYDSSVMERAEFVINTMIHFWLVDSDFSPLSTGLCKANGVIFPFRSVLGETPPTSGLGDVINVFIKYLNLSSVVAMDGPDKADVRSPAWRVGSYDVANTRDAALSINSIGSWNLMIQRPLYRFILRTFLFCPVESSIKNASQAFALWVSYMEPWSISFEEFADLNETLGLPTVSSANSANKASTPGYTSSWQGFVLDNYLFYSSLVMHFIGFAHKFLHTDAEIIVQMVAKVINILTSSVELMDLIKNVNTIFHSKAAAEPSKSMLTGLNRYIPTIRQQLQDWEDGLCESDADGSFLLENWNKDLRLFADGEDGGQQLLQLFLLRAESELQSISGNNLSQNLQCLDSLKAQLSQLFGGSISKSPPGTPQLRHQQQSREEIFKPRSFGSQTGAEIKYRGDWMKRPVSSDEIAWLASVLVSISGWLNEKVGLNQVGLNQGASGWSYLEVLSDVKNVQGTKETLKVVLSSFLSWVLWLGEAGVQLMRRHGLRVNLRMLASKKIVAMVLVFTMFNLLKRAFAL
ncbi:sphingomyelin phosphodiesterase [Perilla frutescens var. hirtella]|uniref:Sphingomyelin phosphodiesterase n=1 Tax=Perilla frutescens var. hirtella TaxID=608512 RepID=A0AAD4JB67_PERFH|nr:sphingomyelin phosphodiesterase [Perilla frutescens var. hirtella]